MSWGVVASAVIGAGSSYLSGKSARKAAKQQAPTVDLDALNQLINRQAEANARKSLALEQELTPENAELRRTATSNLLNRARSGDRFSDEALQSVLNELRSITNPESRAVSSGSLRAPLLEQAINQASSDLRQGGALPVDVRNQVTRRAAANAARVSGGGLGLARFIAPRDLGLTSLQVRDQRLERAGQMGAAQAGYNSSRATTVADSRNRVADLVARLAQQISGTSANRTAQDLALASFGQQLQPPTVGLDPASAANISVGNQTNQYQAKQNAIGLNNVANQNNLQALSALLSIFNKQPA